MTFIIYYRRQGGSSWIFRSTDADRFAYKLDAVEAEVKILATSSSGKRRLLLNIHSTEGNFKQAFGDPVYIPTKSGFSNKPGCRETYVAKVTVTCEEYDFVLKKFLPVGSPQTFSLAALEFGGSFQGRLQTSGGIEAEDE